MKGSVVAAAAAVAAMSLAPAGAAIADGDLSKVNHIIIVMQENHSFDNYFGVLPYAHHTPYHPPLAAGVCDAGDHRCVDGLTCRRTAAGLKCANHNRDTGPGVIRAFHAGMRCTLPDLIHSWVGSHKELSYVEPNRALKDPLSNGFVRENDAYSGNTDNATMSWYDATDLPFYYDLAEKFAISDRQFASVVGPTIPNRFYLMAGTSFGHLTTSDIRHPSDGYKPITGTIFDLMDSKGVTWGDYYEDLPLAALFRRPDSHTQPLGNFLAQAAGTGPALPQVVFIDPNLGRGGRGPEDDEHPPVDIQRGQAHVSEVINAVRNGPYWKDSIILVTYDEHGGFYDHVSPPAADQGGARTPDGIAPGQCADLSNPPQSTLPGGGYSCASNLISSTDTSVNDAETLCPDLTADPTGHYPGYCASFDQFGIRVPLMVISPFAKAAYVSHIARDHTAMLRLIEDRFMGGAEHSHLTRRDLNAASMEELFDFDASPSLKTKIGTASPPEQDCTPAPSDEGPADWWRSEADAAGLGRH